MKPNRATLLIMLVVFIAPAAIHSLYSIYFYSLAEVLHVKSIFFATGYGTFCNAGNNKIHSYFMHESDVPITLFLVITGFLITRNGALRKRPGLVLTGALLFYSAAYYTMYVTLVTLYNNPLKTLFKGSKSDNDYLPIFGTYFRGDLFFDISMYLTVIISFFLAYKIIFKYWNREWRVKFFTYGIVACILGNLFWFYVAGRLIYGDGITNCDKSEYTTFFIKNKVSPTGERVHSIETPNGEPLILFTEKSFEDPAKISILNPLGYVTYYEVQFMDGSNKSCEIDFTRNLYPVIYKNQLIKYDWPKRIIPPEKRDSFVIKSGIPFSKRERELYNIPFFAASGF